MNLKPLGDRIVVKPQEDEESRTPSGLVIPDTAKEKPQLGDVVAVGPGEIKDGERIPIDVKVGDVVFYSKYGGTEVKVEGVDYLILSSRDALAVLA
jgi:chaperonin GroES